MKHLGLGLFLITLTSGILLFSDWNQRVSGPSKMPKVAFTQYASQKLFDDAVRGMKDAMREAGFADGSTVSFKMFNAENDAGNANTIAKQMAGGGYDLLISMSTLSLQSVANANRDGKTPHIFGAVSDPSVAGVGISHTNPLDHPKHLAGIGTFQPVESAFRLAKQMFPGLERVGVAWNAAEANSEATVKVARRVSKELGIHLLEVNVDSSANVSEASAALIARGAQALWIGGDLTVMVAQDAVINAAKRARIPVFCNMPDATRRGALFDLGANYYDVGREVGTLAAQVLRGTSTASIPIRNVVPEKLFLNQLALQGLKDPWRIPEEIVAKASLIIDATGVHEKGGAVRASTPITKTWKLRLIQLNNAAEAEETEHGLREGLLAAKLTEGHDFAMKAGNAQSDMATLSTLVDAALSEKADLIIVFSTPTLQVALRKVDRTPVVYTYVATGVAAGAGRSMEDHRANITGVDVMSAYPEMVTLLKTYFPNIRRIGTLYSPAETNMVAAKDMLEKAATEAGMEVVAVPVNTSTEVADSALALTGRRLDAVVQLSGNITAISFGAILQAANKAKIPTFAFTKPQALAGASVSLARDYEESGKMAADLVARIMHGEDPKSIPFQALKTTTLWVNPTAGRAMQIQIPAELVRRADHVLGQ